MAVSVRKITLWRAVVDNRPGALAEVLDPVWAAGADLQVVMGYREPGQPTKAVIELYPVRGREATRWLRRLRLRERRGRQFGGGARPEGGSLIRLD